jgi:CheY-like chemotaxis protein
MQAIEAAVSGGVSMRPGERVRVLVVEDQPAIRELLCDLFTLLGHHARPARDGDEALELLAKGAYDLVTTDLAMPGLDGWEVAAAVRQRAPGTAVIIISGSASAHDRDRATAEGIPLLAKPFRIEALRVAMRDLLEDKPR